MSVDKNYSRFKAAFDLTLLYIIFGSKNKLESINIDGCMRTAYLIT